MKQKKCIQKLRKKIFPFLFFSLGLLSFSTAPSPPTTKSVPTPEVPKQKTAPLPATSVLTPSTSNFFYPNPGIVGMRGGAWVGSDHLYNLSNHLNLIVEIDKPPALILPFTQESVKSKMDEILHKAGIHSITEMPVGKPPLPVFHILIMIQPIEKGYSIFCEGRLFEEINNDRVQLDTQTILQAITWENQNFVISSKEDLTAQVFKSVYEIVNTFTERYQFFETIKKEMQRN